VEERRRDFAPLQPGGVPLCWCGSTIHNKIHFKKIAFSVAFTITLHERGEQVGIKIFTGVIFSSLCKGKKDDPPILFSFYRVINRVQSGHIPHFLSALHSSAVADLRAHLRDLSLANVCSFRWPLLSHSVLMFVR
jgi:hypothetical protein